MGDQSRLTSPMVDHPVDLQAGHRARTRATSPTPATMRSLTIMLVDGLTHSKTHWQVWGYLQQPGNCSGVARKKGSKPESMRCSVKTRKKKDSQEPTAEDTRAMEPYPHDAAEPAPTATTAQQQTHPRRRENGHSLREPSTHAIATTQLLACHTAAVHQDTTHTIYLATYHPPQANTPTSPHPARTTVGTIIAATNPHLYRSR